MAAAYRCSRCDEEAGPNENGWITARCGCGAPVIAEARSDLAGRGGVNR